MHNLLSDSFCFTLRVVYSYYISIMLSLFTLLDRCMYLSLRVCISHFVWFRRKCGKKLRDKFCCLFIIHARYGTCVLSTGQLVLNVQILVSS